MAIEFKKAGLEDMIQLDNLNEEALLQNVQVRFNADLIYTYTGTIIVSVNPFKILPIYTSEMVKIYCGKRIGELPPHIFATADSSYRNMRDHRANQSVIISGESGAGKSESTKLILQYLAAMTDNHAWVEQQILEANTILEAFGNAKTVRNNNSSRFGKFVEIHFDGSGKIVGARFIQYLLEKSRVTQHSKGERNYHIFYQLCAGSSKEEKDKLHLKTAADYAYCNVGGAVALEGVDDAEEFQKVKLALTVLGIGDDVQNIIFKILSSILILGELQFEKFTNEKKEEGSKIKNIELLDDIADLLSVNSDSLAASLTRRNMTVRGQNFQIPLKANEASDTRDALAKALYGKLFGWLVDRINTCIYKEESENFIGVLDIFGFENFVTNSFEQLCINYANEKLQQFFNQHIFKLEQEEYTKEKIPWQSIAFVDNQECLELVEKRPVGLLSLLDEECKFPNGTDATFLDKVNQKFAKHKNFATPKRSRTSFIIKHYAGEVAYEIASFLDKNKDTLYEDLVNLIQASETEFLAELFADYSGANVKKTTVGAQFKEQLNSLVQTLANTTPHYVRCIKPNKEKLPNVFTKEMVLEQLRYSGMLETIRIRKSGYPIRYSFESFFKRYGILNFKAKLSDPVGGAKLILTSPKIDPDSWRVGATKVFMRDLVVNQLDDSRRGRLGDIAKIIQRRWRTYKIRKQYKQSRAAAIAMQTAIRARGIKNAVAALRASTTIMQATIRMYHEQKQFVAQRKAATVLQNKIRFLCTPSLNQRREFAAILQTGIRKASAVKQYTKMKDAIFVLQSFIRMAKDKAQLQTLRAEFQKRLASDAGLRKQEEERKKRDEEERKQREEDRKKQEEEAKKKKEEDAKKKAASGDDDDEDLESAFEDMLGDILDDKPSKKDKKTADITEDIDVSGDKSSDDFEKEFMSVLNDITSAANTTVATTPAKSTPTVKKPRTFVLDDNDDDEVGTLDDIEKQFADLDADDDIFADFGAELDGENDDDEPEDKASKSITKMLNEMKDSGLKSRDRAELVRANATTRSDSSEDLKDRSMLDALDKLDDILSAPSTKHEVAEGKDEESHEEITISHPDEEDAEDAVAHPDGADNSYDKSKTKAVKDLSFNVYFDFSDFRFQDYATSRIRPYSIGTLRKKQLSTLEMITFTKSPIPQSMLKLPETLSRESVELFGTIMRFMGDSGKKPTPKQEVEYTHFIVSKAIATEGLRDEIYCGLLRQVTKNPKEESAVRGWQLLALCLGCFPPSEIFIKYVCGFLQNTVKLGGFAEKWAQLCLKRLQRIFVNGPRLYSPSSVEINSIKSSRPIIIRIQLMDRKAKALDFDTSTNPKEIVTTLAQKLELREKSGFSIYEKVDPTTERWISPNELLGDLLYKWEATGWSAESADAKIVFKKRIFINAHHEPSDPVCKDLLFYQALDEVLNDRFPVTEVDVMRLASLEMQIIWGDHDPSKVHIGRQLMTELDRYIPQPMIPLYSPQDWKTRISEMHATLKGRSAEEAKALYMQHVMKWPLYGSTIYTAKAAVANTYNNTTDLCIAVNQEGVFVLNRSTKQILDSVDYPSTTVMAHTNNTFDITARVGDERGSNVNNVRRHKFTTKAGAEIEKLCRAYAAVFRKLGKQNKKKKDEEQDENQPQGPEHEIVLPAPLDADRFSFTAYAEEFLQNKQTEFTKEPIKNGMHKFENAAHDKAAVDIFVLIMKFMEDYPARLNTQPVGKKKPTQAELAQQIISKALKQPKLRNEVFVQLMKQTNKNPTLENEILGWQLLAICAGTFLPTKELMNYLRVHFQEGCKNKVSMEASLLSTLALRKLQRTILNGVRTAPPSSNEIAAITKRKTLITKIHTLDGSFLQIPTDGSTTMKELFTIATRNLGVKELNLFTLYNVVDHDLDREVSVKEAELLGDIMAGWEDQEKQGSASFQIVLKRRDFFNATMQDPIHPIDRDLHFFQSLYNVVHSRYPVTEADAVYLAGLHINLQYGNFDPNKDVIAQVVSELEKYLPKTLISQHSPSDWRNKLLESYSKTQTKSPDETKALYMTHIKKWAYYGSTIFSAKQTLSLNLPKELWLGIAKDAVHVFQPNKKDPVASFPFTQIANWGPSNASFFIMTGSFMQPQKYVFITKQGNDMSDLLHLYINRLVSHK